jgi:hypothetical protein
MSSDEGEANANHEYGKDDCDCAKDIRVDVAPAELDIRLPTSGGVALVSDQKEAVKTDEDTCCESEKTD